MIFLEEIQAWVLKSETFFTHALVEELAKHNGKSFYASDNMIGHGILQTQGLVLEMVGQHFVKDSDISPEIRFAIFEKTIKEGFQHGTLLSNVQRLYNPTEEQKLALERLKEEKQNKLKKLNGAWSGVGMSAGIEKAIKTHSIENKYSQQVNQARLHLDGEKLKELVKEVLTETLNRVSNYEKHLGQSLVGSLAVGVEKNDDDRYQTVSFENSFVPLTGNMTELDDKATRPVLRERVRDILNYSSEGEEYDVGNLMQSSERLKDNKKKDKDQTSHPTPSPSKLGRSI